MRHFIVLYLALFLVACDGKIASPEVNTSNNQQQGINDPTCDFEEITDCDAGVVLGFCGEDIVSSRALTEKELEDCLNG